MCSWEGTALGWALKSGGNERRSVFSQFREEEDNKSKISLEKT